ncbi:MAG TPA: type 4a pilus biogenesis protein PilO [Gaiellaceae bacterium]|nr:type 4a pilus biogenesis protein PilO [Gaiellaceae bacterium]HVN62735.1 type 4a pilus biogenesis protein PilO [Gaiellaceae bacterium]
MKTTKLNRHATIALIVGGDILLLLLGWVLLVSPQRSNAASIAKATQAAQSQIVEAQNALQQAQHPVIPKQPAIRTANLYQLAKAMPATTDMPDLLLEIDAIARDAGVIVGLVSPGLPQPVTGEPYSSVQIQLSFYGDYYQLTDLLYRLRTLVAVEDGQLVTSGRLLAVSQIGMTPFKGRILNTTITINAYVYGPAAASAGTTTPAAPTSTDTTGSTTSSTTTTTTTTSASSDVAP